MTPRVKPVSPKTYRWRPVINGKLQLIRWPGEREPFHHIGTRTPRGALRKEVDIRKREVSIISDGILRLVTNQKIGSAKKRVSREDFEGNLHTVLTELLDNVKEHNVPHKLDINVTASFAIRPKQKPNIGTLRITLSHDGPEFSDYKDVIPPKIKKYRGLVEKKNEILTEADIVTLMSTSGRGWYFIDTLIKKLGGVYRFSPDGRSITISVPVSKRR